MVALNGKIKLVQLDLLLLIKNHIKQFQNIERESIDKKLILKSRVIRRKMAAFKNYDSNQGERFPNFASMEAVKIFSFLGKNI